MTDSNSFLQRYVDLVNTNESPVSPLGLKSSSKTNLLSPSPVKSKLSSPVSLSMADKENQGYKKSFDLPQTPTKSQSVSKAFTADELRYYEFLCRVHEVKVWIESVISEELPSVTELATGDVMRDGVFWQRLPTRSTRHLLHPCSQQVINYNSSILRTLTHSSVWLSMLVFQILLGLSYKICITKRTCLMYSKHYTS